MEEENNNTIHEDIRDIKNIALDAIIESLLFFKAEPVSYTWLAHQLGKTEEEIKNAIETLTLKLQNRGLAITKINDEILLTTSQDMSDYIKELRRLELTKDLSKASLETLSVVMYRENVSRADIDFIRGVNSSFILRNLLVRGLIERKVHPSDTRRYVYTPSFETMSLMGVTRREELPDFEYVVKNLQEKLDGITSTQEEL